MTAPLHIGPDALSQLKADLGTLSPSQIIVLFDENTAKACARHLAPFLPTHKHIKIAAGEAHKNLATCTKVWEKLLDLEVDRKALLINLGGGVVGDLGGFAAGCFKRGIRYVQVPTTLLAMVDASVGNKTGVDFKAGKNLIGMFNPPEGVYIWPGFLATLPERELKSGFAEVIKHWLIGDRKGWEHYSPAKTLPDDLSTLIAESVEVKRRIVAEDPFERGVRKALNFGHTIGHAVESFVLAGAYEETLLHGEAVAIGMICESWISVQRGFLSASQFDSICAYIHAIYPDFRPFLQKLPPQEVFEWLKQDKKNEEGRILCSLLDGIGTCKVNQEISVEDALQSWQAFLDL